MPNWDYYDRDQAIDEAIRLQKEIDDHECDHSDCIKKADLPPLPAGWCGPWSVYDCCVMGMQNGCRRIYAECTKKEADALAALLNVTHPSPTKEGE